MAYQSITRRWLFNSLGFVVILLTVAEVALIFFVRDYYYNSAQRIVQSSADFGASNMQSSYGDSRVNFTASVRSMVENFDDKNTMELMAIDHNGRVSVSSSGFESNLEATEDTMPDYEEAMNSSAQQAVYNGTLESTGEHILAITVVCPDLSSEYSAIRYVVSLAQVDKEVLTLILAGTGGLLLVLALVLVSNSFFIRSILMPVREITGVAKQFATGNMSARILKKTDDEIGELGEVINNMADQIQETERMKNEFISSVSHELRTPLTAIRGWGETMLMDENIDHATLETGMGVIMRETERLSDMVEELLDFSRMQSGRMKLVKSKMDVLAELSEAVIMYTERAKREGMLLIYDEPDLFVPVFGDRGKLRQVFINVIDNALKYSDPGDTTTVSARVEGNNIIIEVEDTGCGISAADLPKIKTKFYKANLTRRGSGIGLAVADEIIQMHGGRLDVSSVEGEGTTVTITLPIMERGDDSTQISEATAEKAAPPSDAAVHLNKLDLSDIEDN